jgi:cold shock CspA family protein
MPKASKFSSLEQQKNLKVAQQMFSQKKDFAGEKSEIGLVGQIVYWDVDKDFGFIRTPDRDASDDFYCRGQDFLTACVQTDIVKFDVWENHRTGSRKAVNVTFHCSANKIIASDQSGFVNRWGYNSRRGVIKGSDGQEYACAEKDFQQGSCSRGDRVCFDVMEDFLTSRLAATNIRKPVRHVHLAGAEGRLVHLGPSFGFVSTKHCDKDVYFNARELTRVTMEDIHLHQNVMFHVIMEEDGSFTAENINMQFDMVKKSEPTACDADETVSVTDDISKKTPAVDDDSASTAAATDVPDVQVEALMAVSTEKRKPWSRHLRNG